MGLVSNSLTADNGMDWNVLFKKRGVASLVQFQYDFSTLVTLQTMILYFTCLLLVNQIEAQSILLSSEVII